MELTERTPEHQSAQTTKKPKKIDVSLSGGGIRSACYCAGVLSGLLENNSIEIDNLCTVSGGGYLATSLISHMLLMPDTTSQGDALKKVMEKFKKNTGYLIHWGEGCSGVCNGLLDTVVLFFFIIILIIMILLSNVHHVFIPLPVLELLALSMQVTESESSLVVDPSNSFFWGYLLIFIFGLGLVLVATCLPDKTPCKFHYAKFMSFFGLGLIIFASIIEYSIFEISVNSITFLDTGTKIVNILIWVGWGLSQALTYAKNKIFSCFIGVAGYVALMSALLQWRLQTKNNLISFWPVGYSNRLYWGFVIVAVFMYLFSFLTTKFKQNMLHKYYEWRLVKSFYPKKEEYKTKSAEEEKKTCCTFERFNPKMEELKERKKKENSHIPNYIGVTAVNGWFLEEETGIYTIQASGMERDT